MLSVTTDEYSEIALQIDELQKLADQLAKLEGIAPKPGGGRDTIRWRDGEFVCLTQDGPWRLGKYDAAKATLLLLAKLSSGNSGLQTK